MSTPRLSIIVVAFDMPREIPRTVLSLSPSMQRDVDRDDYEIIVVDSGSTKPFDEEACLATGANVRFERVVPDAPTPCRAINRGLEIARGELCGVSIDGARLASPGIVVNALRAARLSPRTVISTLGFHLGPDNQVRSMKAGYDQAEEDRLLDSVRWTEDGYRLFDISVFAGSSQGGWFAPMIETNLLLMRKPLWEAVGGYDERFRSPGGGIVNHDTYDRACSLPNTLLVTLLGEGSFHQIHGGVATNATHSNWEAFVREYVSIRGRRLGPPRSDALLLGNVRPNVLRSIATSAGEATQRT